MEPILEVRDVTKAFSQSGRPDFIAVDHISFRLLLGQVLGLVGESGSGKSTIARALMGSPRLLILDEATSALDVTVQQQILELLTKLQKEKGLSYLFICHNLALVQRLCDRVLVLHGGKIVEQGPPEDVIFRPRSEYTRRLVEAVLE